jgi:hypothetical protein
MTMSDESRIFHSDDDDPVIRQMAEQGHAKAVEELRAAGVTPGSMWVVITFTPMESGEGMSVGYKAAGQGPWLGAWRVVRDIAQRNIDRAGEL